MTTTTSGSTIIRTLQSSSGEIDFLGHIVWWSIREVRISRDWFVEKLKECGLSEKYAPKHNFRSALVRCLNALEEERLIRKIKEDSERVSYQFTRENLVDDPDDTRLEYIPETKVVIDKDAYRIEEDIGAAIVECDPKLKEFLVARFWEEKSTYISSDITRYIQRVFSDYADLVSLRQQGNVYFVPAPYSDLVEKVASIVESIPGGTSTLDRIPIPNVEASRKTVGEAVVGDITGILDRLEQEINSAENATEKWSQHRIDRLMVIKKRIELYADVLGSSADQLDQSADDKIQALQKAMGKRTLDM